MADEFAIERTPDPFAAAAAMPALIAVMLATFGVSGINGKQRAPFFGKILYWSPKWGKFAQCKAKRRRFLTDGNRAPVRCLIGMLRLCETLKPTMHPLRYRLWNPEGCVTPFTPGLFANDLYHSRLFDEQTPDRALAQQPNLREFAHCVVPFKGKHRWGFTGVVGTRDLIRD